MQRHEATITQLEGRARQGMTAQLPEDNSKISRECSLQWQEVNSLLEDEIGRMRWLGGPWWCEG